MPTDPSGGDDAAASHRHPAPPASAVDDARGAPSPAAPIALPARLVTATRGEWRDDLAARGDAAIEHAAQLRSAEITLDLRDTVEIDASGLGLLVVVRQRARDHGVAVRVLSVATPIRQLLAATRLDRLFFFDE